MTKEKKVLVCGASISGTAIAYWLAKSGFKVVIAEKSDSFREGGQNVDVKDFAQDILKLMGIDREVNAKNTGEAGLKYLNAKENVISTFPKGAVGGLTSDYEILRGDLARIIYEKTKSVCEYRFRKFVKNVSENAEHVVVTFNDESVEEFSMLICAEGIGSSTRDMVMPEFTHYNYLGAYMSFFTIPQTKEDDLWAKAYQVEGGAMVFLRPGHENETTVLVSFLKEIAASDVQSITEQKMMLKGVLAGKGGIADRVAQNLDGVKDMYYGPMSQVKASKWHKGNVVLLGDAAHAPTPFTGMGTALALMGAYILAGEIVQNNNIETAFQAYERIFKPFVDLTQSQITPKTMRLLHPKSKCGISVTRFVTKVLANGFVQKRLQAGSAKNKKKTPAFILPNYPGITGEINNKGK